MNLILTEEQKKYLNKKSPLKASSLERVFERSVKDQEEIRRQAASIRRKRNS